MRSGRRRPALNPHNGLALATTLYIVFAVLTFGLTLATLASFEYQLTNESVNRGRALQAAEAGLAQAMYDLGSQPNWGLKNESDSGTVASDRSHYNVSFDASGSAPWSVNNLSQPKSVPGYRGQVVPPYTALIVSQGTAGGAAGGTLTKRVEALVQFPNYPYAIAASGQVHCAGPMLVSGVGSVSDFLGGNMNATGNVWAGSTASAAVQSGPLSIVSGFVRTEGTAALGIGSVVAKGIYNNDPAETLPDVPIGNYNTQNMPGVTVITPGLPISVVNGPTYVGGSLTMLGAVLVNADLYVDGDLTCIGALSGTGTIFVNGKTNLEGALSLVLGNGIAIFSQGDINVTGGNFFQGVLYSHGSVHAVLPLAVVGSVIAQGGDVTMSTLANVTYVSDYTQFGGPWSKQGMQCDLISASSATLHVLFWRELP